MWNVYIRDYPAHYVQFDLNLQCPQELFVSLSVRKELIGL